MTTPYPPPAPPAHPTPATQSTAPPAPTVSDRTAGALLACIAAEQAEHRLPSVVAGVVRDGALVWTGGRGEVEGCPPGADLQYRIGSITKTFVAVCVLRLCEEGAVDLTDRLEAHVPGTGVGEVTVAQLLSHSAGLRAETAGPWWERTPGGDLDQLVAGSLAPGGLRFDPGRTFHYSNVGYGLLGALIAARRSAPWHDVVRCEVLEPLAMTRTTTRPAAPSAPGLAVHPWADVVLAEPEHDAGAMGPAGQLWSTVADLARWAAWLTGDGAGILAPATMAAMREPRVVEDDRDVAWVDAYGLGLQVWNDAGTRSFGHGGSMPGFRAFLRGTDDGDAAVGFANSTAGLRHDLGADLLRILRTEEPRLPREWRPSAPDDGILTILGPWYWGAAPLVLRAHDGMLELEGLGGPGRGSRFARPDPDAPGTATGAWTGLDGYHTGEPLTVVADPDGGTHLEIGSFVYTREPYGPAGAIPGGLDPGGWRPAGDRRPADGQSE